MYTYRLSVLNIIEGVLTDMNDKAHPVPPACVQPGPQDRQGAQGSYLPRHRMLLCVPCPADTVVPRDLTTVLCQVGVDVRKAVTDGFPVENALGSDLHPGRTRSPHRSKCSVLTWMAEYWDLGHKLFKTTAKEFPAHFIGGDAFSPDFFETAPVFDSTPNTPAPALSSLQTLTPMNGRVSAIHASSFFHLFDEAKQFELARKLAGLLSPEPGSIILGGHAGQPVKGMWDRRTLTSGGQMFCHSPESWRELWDEQVFEKGKVKVDVVLKPVRDLVQAEDSKEWIDKAQKPEMLDTGDYQVLIWSVTRL